MGIISWIVFGLIAGILAKWIMPGKDGGGFIMTVILGVVGAVVGGFISTKIFGMGAVDGFNLGSFVVAVVGALVVLFVYRKIRS
ncbi:GlsB/YeaQ/YmgE family stress response membrane protein [Serratia fonticola]|uniref:GlsB/YeaQ/YmgE family stress response membrane protein n=1 Tax=Serratia fonticola TaxID=47917 RepID=UPI00301D6F1B